MTANRCCVGHELLSYLLIILGEAQAPLETLRPYGVRWQSEGGDSALGPDMIIRAAAQLASRPLALYGSAALLAAARRNF